MLDPIGSLLRIRDLYITYLETAFRIRDPGVSRERRQLLESPGTLCTEPLVEPLPRYQSCGYRVDELVTSQIDSDPLPGFDELDRAAWADLVLSGLFESEATTEPESPTRRRATHTLWEHQLQMLRKGVRGEPAIVTSATGSGKTESFLLPVFAMLTKEARRWPPPEAGYLQHRWWHDPSGAPHEKYADIPQSERPLKRNPSADPFRPHRLHEKRPAAVRALILYPMNALVEDQLVRLRPALDSDAVRQVMNREFGGNRFFLGRYTGSTEVTGFNVHPRIAPLRDLERRKRKLEKLFDVMRQLERTQKEARDLAALGRLEGEGEARFLFPSVDGAELCSRWDMQCYPPDILITNVSMLSAMLAREVDAPIFDKTREWIERSSDAYFFLILDELHLQRGASGTEVAYLLRLLLERLGLTRTEHRHKLRILASSASLPVEGEEGERSVQYLWDMYGRHGTWNTRHELPEAEARELWRGAIVPGVSEDESPAAPHTLQPAPYRRFLAACLPPEATFEPAANTDPRIVEREWRQVAGDLVRDRAIRPR